MARAGRWHRRAPESGRRHQGREQPAPLHREHPGCDRAAHPAAGLRRTRTAPESAADLTTSCFPHRARGPGRPAQGQRRAPSSPEEGRQQPPPPAAHPRLPARREAPGHGDPGTGLPPAGSAPDAWTRTRSPLPARGGRPPRASARCACGCRKPPGHAVRRHTSRQGWGRRGSATGAGAAGEWGQWGPAARRGADDSRSRPASCGGRAGQGSARSPSFWHGSGRFRMEGRHQGVLVPLTGLTVGIARRTGNFTPSLRAMPYARAEPALSRSTSAPP